MATASTAVPIENNSYHLPGGAKLIDMSEWMRAEDEKDAKQEADKLNMEGQQESSQAVNGLKKEGGMDNSKKEAPKKPNQFFGATAIVTGRPTTGAATGTRVQVDLGGKNWTGLLLEYRNAHPEESGPIYQEASPSIESFICSVEIGECPTPFGIDGPACPKKKDAKQYASKLAIEWLIANAYMPADGSVSFPKIRPPVVVTRSAPRSAPRSAGGGGDGGEVSPGQKVSELCGTLGLPPPTYVITPHESFPSMYHGYAHFSGHLVSHDRVGEFENVFGRAKAKVECARAVLVFLLELQKTRLEAGRRVEG